MLELFATKLFHQSAIGADEIRKLAEDATKEQDAYGLDFMQWFAVFSEFHNFYLHMLDRTACRLLPESARAKLIPDIEKLSVCRAIETICNEWPEDRIRDVQREALGNVHKAHEEFGQFTRVLSNPGESPSGSLVWEFAKSVANYAGRPMNMDYIMLASKCAVDGWIALDIKSFITQWSSEHSS